jgi:hypothetical protein
VGSDVLLPGSGRLYEEIIEQWNGRVWSLANPRSTAASELDGVACTSATQCLAVGKIFPKSSGLRPLVQKWDGSKWSDVSAPTENGDDFLSAIGCQHSAACFAVGSNFSSGTSTYGELTSAERLSGSTWMVVHSISPSAGNDNLNSVSCPVMTSCFAVGNFNGDAFSGGGNRPLIERWRGTSWAKVASPVIHESNVVLYGVDCFGAKLCFAVGDQGSNTAHSLIERWNGSSWSQITSPRSTYLGTGFVVLNSVTCISASNCVSVGHYPDSSGTLQSLVERWNGSAWSELSAPNVDG